MSLSQQSLDAHSNKYIDHQQLHLFHLIIMSRIAVITRTKNRPLLLNRCLDSLIRQTYRDFLWVVVNDNGNVEEVDSVVNRAVKLGIPVQVIHRTVSNGVAAAANDGILRSTSEFIHIHDDDDTLEPSFYSETVRFLDEKPHYLGVVTSTTRVDEKIESDHVTVLSRYEYYKFDSTLYIADLIWKNQFSPISFVYRRETHKTLGMYDETLPVLEDWDFNLRFVQLYDIGVVPKFLANYHWRTQTKTGSLAQTVTSGSALHREFTAIIRNKLLRQDIASGKLSIGSFMVLGRYHQLQSNAAGLMHDKIDALLLFRRLAKKLLAVLPFKYIRR